MSISKRAKGTVGSTRTNPNPRKAKKNRILYEAVVTNFFSNPVEDLEKNPPNDPDKTYRQSMRNGFNKVVNPNLIGKMPRCSVTARIVSDNAAWSDNNTAEIFFPLFPHVTMPVKPGEKIWVIFESDRSASSRGYWIGRIS